MNPYQAEWHESGLVSWKGQLVKGSLSGQVVDVCVQGFSLDSFPAQLAIFLPQEMRPDTALSIAF